MFNEQPHLIASEHSSVQFLFMRKLIHTTKLNQCRITYEENGQLNNDGGLQVKGKKFGERFGTHKHVLQYKVKTRASTAGICYHFETGSQIFRTELGVSGFAADRNAILLALAKMQEDLQKVMDGVPGSDDMGITGAIRFMFKMAVAALPGVVAGYIKNVKTDPTQFKKEHNLVGKENEAHSSTDATEVGAASRQIGGGTNDVPELTAHAERYDLKEDLSTQEGRQSVYGHAVSEAKKEAVRGAG